MSHECIPEASLLISHGSHRAAYPPQPVIGDIVAGIHSGNCCWGTVICPQLVRHS